MSTLGERSNNLALMSHTALLDKVIGVLRDGANPFRPVRVQGRDYLYVRIDEIARTIAHVHAPSLPNPVQNKGKDPSCVTMHGTPQQERDFAQRVRALERLLADGLTRAVAPTGIDVPRFVAELCTPLSDFAVPRVTGLGFAYELHRHASLKRQRLTTDAEEATEDDPLLRHHRLSIAVTVPSDFIMQTRDALVQAIDNAHPWATNDDREELLDLIEEQVADTNSPLHRLRDVLSEETVGQLKKQARICCARYLEAQLAQGEARTLLHDLRRRLEAVTAYVHDTSRAEADDAIYYDTRQYGISDLLASGHAFNELPLIPLVEDNLIGETVDPVRGQQTYTFGLKLKLNGPVAATHERSSFAHYTTLLRHPEEMRWSEKMLRVFLLYYLVFKNWGDLSFDPLAALQDDLLPLLRDGTDEEKRAFIAAWATDLQQGQTEARINLLAHALRDVIRRKRVATAQSWPVHIGVLPGILERNLRTIFATGSLFRADVFGAQTPAILRYVAVTPSQLGAALIKVQASIAIEDVRYFPAINGVQEFGMTYAIEDRRALPVLLTPYNAATKGVLAKNFASMHGIVLQYNAAAHNRDTTPRQWFVYRYVYALLTYLALSVVVRHAPADIYLPMLRLHLKAEDASLPNDEEDFLHGISKVLAHVLSEDYLANAQGYVLSSTLPQAYRLTNTLSSLHSVLPKTFQCPPGSHRPHLDRMALIVVSSRECDSVYGDPYKISTLYGEIVGIERGASNTVRVRRLKTFSGTYDSAALHTAPTILFDEAHKLYQAGYRQIIYVAKAPYTSTLRLTRGEPSDTLFFMSRAIMGALKAGKPDLKIYPVFCAEYYAVKVRTPQVDSLYIQDVQERGALLQDENRRVVAFLELFNGRTIYNAAERVYNGVISYATMLNMHEGILDNNDTVLGLLADGPLKDDIIFYLTLFHFARYEAHGRNVILKLDPYEGIIGDQSVGALARRPHLAPHLSFNFLAFLSGVRKVVVAGEPAAGRIAS